MNSIKLKDIIENTNEKNSDNEVKTVLGININKEFMPSIGNITIENLVKYKIIHKDDFACNLMHIGRDEVLVVAKYNEAETAIVSPSYKTFKVTNPNILPEYLMLYFKRPVMDRMCWFYTDASIRGSLSWKAFKELEVNIPSLEIQKNIIKINKLINKQIDTIKQINNNLEKILQNTFFKWFIKYEGYTGNYKNSKIGFIPESWNLFKLEELVDVIDNRGKTPPYTTIETKYPIIEVKALSGGNRIINYEQCSKFVNEDVFNNWFRAGHPQELDILFSTVGTIGELKIYMESKGTIAQNVVAFRSKKDYSLYLYQYLKHIKKDIIGYDIGSVQPSIKVTHVLKHHILIPTYDILKKYNNLSLNITKIIYLNTKEIEKLTKLRDTLLPKLMSGEIDISDINIE